MCQCFGGQEVDWENLRTPEQQDLMKRMLGPILTGMQTGATQFPGQLSAPMTDMQKMAAKTMSKQGGFGWEQQSPKYRPVPSMDVPLLDYQPRGGSASSGEKGQPGLTPYDVQSGPKQPGGPGGLIPHPGAPPGGGPPGPGGPGGGPGRGDDERRQKAMMLMQMLAMGGQPGGQSAFDPRNIRPM